MLEKRELNYCSDIQQQVLIYMLEKDYTLYTDSHHTGEQHV